MVTYRKEIIDKTFRTEDKAKGLDCGFQSYASDSEKNPEQNKKFIAQLLFEKIYT